jgi:exodeoxyribonuclease VII small subunit
VTARPDIEDLSYEQARDELVGIVAKLEIGAVTLEESLELWERGEALAVRCQHILQGARARVAGAGGDRAGEEGAGDDASPAAGTSA